MSSCTRPTEGGGASSVCPKQLHKQTDTSAVVWWKFTDPKRATTPLAGFFMIPRTKTCPKEPVTRRKKNPKGHTQAYDDLTASFVLTMTPIAPPRQHARLAVCVEECLSSSKELSLDVLEKETDLAVQCEPERCGLEALRENRDRLEVRARVRPRARCSCSSCARVPPPPWFVIHRLHKHHRVITHSHPSVHTD